MISARFIFKTTNKEIFALKSLHDTKFFCREWSVRAAVGFAAALVVRYIVHKRSHSYIFQLFDSQNLLIYFGRYE